ncbi:spermine synthase [Luteolibacter marinus]|uniref:spermine synthase n=1 Tax=Luteolibacter marinus TaxID=2776705 RepID=UPI001D015F72|nr:spermine synthase [Luteolibacter marinus]
MKVTTTLASCHTPDGALMVLQEHDGQYFLKIGGVQLMSTTASASEQTMAELACAAMPARPRILIGGLGFGFTLKRVLELCPPDAVVEVAELLQEVIDWNREHLASVNGTLLDDPRVTVHLRDVHDLLGSGRYHAILLDVDNSPDPLVQRGNARLYDRGGISRVKSALHPGGRVVYWSANRDRAFARSLERSFKKVECVGAKAYPQAKKFTHTLFVADRD